MALSEQVRKAIFTHGVTTDNEGRKILAYEVDCQGNYLKMDDANIPSLLSLPYLGFLPQNDPLYINTRSFVLSSNNPYFFRGSAGEGVGSPHTYGGYIWPMSVIMRAMTTNNDEEIKESLKTLKACTCSTGNLTDPIEPPASNYRGSAVLYSLSLSLSDRNEF